MSDDARTPPLATEMGQALGLLRASHNLYGAILSAVKESVAEDGSPDLPALFRRLNAVLTGFAPHDRLIRQLLARYEA